MDVSILIVNWNTLAITRECLESVYQQTEGIDFEVIVVDNASTDGSVAMIRSEFPQAILIENKENKGFAAANNQAMALAQGRYYLLLNSDTLVLENAVAMAVTFIDQHDKAGVVGCRVLNPDRSLQPTCFMFPSLLNMFLACTYLYKVFPRSRFFGREQMTWWDRGDIREVDVVTGCFMLVRRSALEQVGVMDERFFMYGEETDWCYRFKEVGWQSLFTPEPEIIHLGGQSSAMVRIVMLVQLRLSILEYMRKHHGALKYRMGCFLTVLYLVFRIPVWLGLALVNRKKRQRSMDRVVAYSVAVKKIVKLMVRGDIG